MDKIGFLDVYSFNKRAIRAYEKVGFKAEGVRRQALYLDSTYYDSLIMGLLEHELAR